MEANRPTSIRRLVDTILDQERGRRAFSLMLVDRDDLDAIVQALRSKGCDVHADLYGPKLEVTLPVRPDRHHLN